MEVTRQVGELARPVDTVAKENGLAWGTTMDAVRYYGQPLVDAPDRIGVVRAMGVDETKWLSADGEHSTRYVSSIVNLDRRTIVDLIEGNSAADIRIWCATRPRAFLRTVQVVATDLTESYRRGIEGFLDQAMRVADPFHVVRVANRTLDLVRRRVQNQTLGHRGRKNDPLYRIRKLLAMGAERLSDQGHERLLLSLRLGDPDDEVVGAWLAKESVRDLYLTDDVEEAATLLDKVIVGCQQDVVPEIRSLGPDAQPLASGDLEPPPHRRQQRPDRGAEPLCEEGQALRPWLPRLRELPSPGPAVRRRRRMAPSSASTRYPLMGSLLIWEAPLMRGPIGGNRAPHVRSRREIAERRTAFACRSIESF